MASEQDPTIARVREARHAASVECNHDPGKLVAYYIQMQKDQATRMAEVGLPPEKRREDERQPFGFLKEPEDDLYTTADGKPFRDKG